MEYRYEIVNLSEKENLTEREISLRLGIPRTTVHYWLTKRGQKSNSKSGRPRITDETLDKILYETIVQKPFLSAVDLHREFASHCSVDTIRNRLKQMGMKCRIPARKPFLTAYHREKRHAFAVNKIDWDFDQWSNVVFSDEKIFRASSRGPLRVYRPKHNSDRFDKRYLVSTSNPQGRFTICVWMAFGGPGPLVKKIIRIEQKTLNSEYYTKRILPSIEDEVTYENLIFMHDRSPIHTSKVTEQWLKNRNWRIMYDWPPKGPDMNPVENVWAELVRRIEFQRGANGTCQNRDQLWEDIKVAFYSLPNEYFIELIQSMRRRIADVLYRGGGWTKY